VIEAARPVNLAMDRAGGEFGGGVVDYVMGIVWVGGVWSGRVWRVNHFYYSRVA